MPSRIHSSGPVSEAPRMQRWALRLPLRRQGLFLAIVTITPFFVLGMLQIGRVHPVYLGLYVACIGGCASLYPRIHPFGKLTAEEREGFVVTYVSWVAPWVALRRAFGRSGLCVVGVGAALGFYRAITSFDRARDTIGLVVSAGIVLAVIQALRTSD